MNNFLSNYGRGSSDFFVKKCEEGHLIDFLTHKGLSINYVDKNEGMKSTLFSALALTLFSSESS